MSTPPRELVVLGTASQAPTRDRNHNGYLLRWDQLGLLCDPGEGTQRQMLIAGVRSSQVTHILITHQHGDHCLGLPGVLQRMALDQRTDPVHLVHPVEATPYIDRLLGIGLFDGGVDIVRVPLPQEPSIVALAGGATLHAVPLDHRVPCLGYRLQEPAHAAFDPAALARAGLHGPVVGQLAREGRVVVEGRTVTVEEVSEAVPGQAYAFVMDTRVCEGAARLLDGVDLGVVEATFHDGEEELAQRFGHMTAGQAGRLAAQAGVRRLVLTHFSQRHPEGAGYAAQAAVHHADVVPAEDLMRIPVPPRPPRPADG